MFWETEEGNRQIKRHFTYHSGEVQPMFTVKFDERSGDDGSVEGDRNVPMSRKDMFRHV